MTSPGTEATSRPRVVAELVAGASALVAAIWISISAAAPEFLWQGLWIAFGHVSPTDLISALLIGLILAFFVEPAMERARRLVRPQHGRGDEDSGSTSLLFTACLGIVFAMVGVCLHDAIVAFIAGHGGGQHEADRSGLMAAIALTVAWALVPFAITLAWLSVRRRRLAIPLGILAALSTFVAGVLFAWPWQSVTSTFIPCALILGFGYRQAIREPAERVFLRCAWAVAVIATIWLVTALVVDTVLGYEHAERFRLYTAADFWMDLRFYVGWTAGLLLAPFPYRR